MIPSRYQMDVRSFDRGLFQAVLMCSVIPIQTKDRMFIPIGIHVDENHGEVLGFLGVLSYHHVTIVFTAVLFERFCERMVILSIGDIIETNPSGDIFR